jgi:heat shock protein HtpX
MQALDDRELSAVLAHELSHIRNGDARLGVIAAVFVGVITLVTDPVWRVLRLGGRGAFRIGGRRSSSSSRGRGGGVAIVLILIAVAIAVLAHVLALVLRMALSRNREYLADAGAVEMTQDADAMIGALRKVAQRPGLQAVSAQVRALFLHDAALSRASGLFATHPPIEERVAALVRFGGGHDPGPLPELEDEVPKPAPPWTNDADTDTHAAKPVPPWRR